MAAYALLIGTKNGKRTLITDGPPAEVRRLFKTSTDGEGYESLEVIESTVGRTRRRGFPKAVQPVAKKTAKPDK